MSVTIAGSVFHWHSLSRRTLRHHLLSSVSTSGFCCFGALKAKSNKVCVRRFIFSKPHWHNMVTKTFLTSDFRPPKPPQTIHITATFFSKLLIGPNWPIINWHTLDYTLCTVPMIWFAAAARWICGLFAFCAGERPRRSQDSHNATA